MHGSILKTAEGYLRANHGAAAWRQIAQEAGLPPDGVLPMETYPDQVMVDLVAAAARVTSRTPLDLLEDVGTWICSDPRNEAIRRLFRFSGRSFPDLLYALDDVQDRAHMALADLELPALSLTEQGQGRFRLASTWPLRGAGAVLIGLLRALADDYGALAVVAHEGTREASGFFVDMLSIRLLDEAHQEARAFDLGGAA